MEGRNGLTREFRAANLSGREFPVGPGPLGGVTRGTGCDACTSQKAPEGSSGDRSGNTSLTVWSKTALLDKTAHLNKD